MSESRQEECQPYVGFVSPFAEDVWMELQERGIKVLSLPDCVVTFRYMVYPGTQMATMWCDVETINVKRLYREVVLYGRLM